MGDFQFFLYFFLTLDHYFECVLSSFSFLCEEKNVRFPMSRHLPCLPNHGFILFWYLCLQVSMHTLMLLCLGICLCNKFTIFISHSVSPIMISLVCHFVSTGINNPFLPCKFINHTFPKYWHSQRLFWKFVPRVSRSFDFNFHMLCLEHHFLSFMWFIKMNFI